MEEKHDEYCGEKDKRGGGAEREEGCEGDGDGEERPAEVFDAGGGEVGDEGKGFGEGGVEGDGLDAVAFCGGKVRVSAGELDDAAAAFLVTDHASVDGCLADEGVGAVDVGGGRVVEGVFCRTAYDEGPVIDILSSHGVWSGDMDGLAVCGTPERLVCILKRATSVPIDAATITPRP